MAASMPRLSRNPVNVLPRKKKMANGTTMIAQQIIITKCNGFDRPVRLSSVFPGIICYLIFLPIKHWITVFTSLQSDTFRLKTDD